MLCVDLFVNQEFKPERFHIDNLKNMDSYAYTPFAAGQRLVPDIPDTYMDFSWEISIYCHQT